MIPVDAAIAPVGQADLLRDAQEKLGLSEAVQRDVAATQSSILDALPAHIALIDHEGVIIAVNDGWRRYAARNGLRSAQWGLGQNYLEVCERAQGESSEEACAVAAGIRSVLGGKTGHFSREYSCHSPSERRWFCLTVNPLEDERQGAAVVMHMNVTERKLVEEALLESEERFRGTFEQAAVGIAHVSMDGSFLRVNDKLCQILGYDRKELLSMTFGELTLAEDQDTGEEARREMLSGERSSHVAEKRFRRRNGGVVWAQLITTLERTERGEAKYFLSVLEDITSRKRAESALHASERQFSSAFQFAAIGIALVAADGRWLKVNRALCQMLGYTEAELLDRTFQQITHPEDLDTDLENLRQLLAGAGQSYQMEKRYLHRRGHSVWALLSVSLVRDEQGQPVHFISQIQDITEQRQSREAARRSVREQRKLAEELEAVNRALLMLRNCGEALIRAEHEQELLDQICRIVVEGGGYRMAWVGYAPCGETGLIEPRAHAGAEDGYLSEITIGVSEHEPAGLGPAAKTIRNGSITLCEDISESPDFYWQEEALRHGYRSVICLPLRDDAGTFGLMSLHSADVRRVGEDEIQLLKELADDLAFGIVTLRSRHERHRIETAVLSLAAGVSAATGMEFFAQLASKMADALGAQAGYVTRLLPGEPLRGRTVGAVDGQAVAPFEHVLSGTPCESLIDRDESIVASGLGERYPEDRSRAALGAQAFAGRRLMSSSGQPIGLLFVLFRDPLRPSSHLSSTLQIFATRAAAELDRQQADAHIHEQASMLDEATDAIFVRDLDHWITYWNKSAERLFGWTAAEAIGQSALDILHGDAVAFREATESVLATGQWSGELRSMTRSGALLTVECRWTLLHDENAGPKSILTINTDVTERRKLEAQFLRAQRMDSIGTLAGGIAHDLNNLLAPIMLGVSLLKRSEGREKVLSVIRNIESSAKRGANLVKQVLSFGRGVDGARVPVRLDDIVSEIETIVTSTFPKNITLDREIAKDLRLIVGDPTQLHQVVLNLCVNARDAMPDGGRLTLSARNVEIDEQYAIMSQGMAVAGDYVVLEVADEGCGMAREVMDQVFDPFFTTKEIGQGTGIGLSTVTGIVRSHGGFVDLQSEVGAGSVFRVYLPAAPADSLGAAVVPNVESLPHGQGELILVVDDEDSILSITSQTLEAFGYRTIVAEDGAQAIGLYAMHRAEVALVLTDMMMPVMDGPALIGALYRINPKVRIIATSGLGASDTVARATNAGVVHFLAKPFSAEAMLSLLREALSPGDSPGDGDGGS